jgi:maltose-binding protein MalE
MKELAGGGMYGLPVSNQIMVMYCNKELFDKFGVSYPINGMNWDAAIELGKKMTRMDAGVQYLGLAVSSRHILRMNPFALPFVDAKTGKSTSRSDGFVFSSYKCITRKYEVLSRTCMEKQLLYQIIPNTMVHSILVL